MSKKNTELKVGDWVKVRLVGIDQGNQPAYQIESIDKDEYVVVQTEGTYQHRIKTEKGKLTKL
tara:strand:- start:299 stop:487 length:189 start_codon:yes stop_codon:yes gene_type:complete